MWENTQGLLTLAWLSTRYLLKRLNVERASANHQPCFRSTSVSHSMLEEK